MDLEGLPVVAGAMAYLARHVYIRKEVHFDLDGAVAGAVLAATALHIEGETAWLVPANLRFGRLGEEPPYVVEDPGIGGRVGPRRTADRGLIDVDDLVDLIGSADRTVAAGHIACVVDPP